MRRKSSKQLFSVLMAATMVMSGISIPVNASQVDDAVVRSVLTKTEAEASESREINFNEGWKFHYGDVENAEKKDFDDSDLAKWGNLKLPHDFSITQEPSNSNEAESGFMPGGTGWYRKNFTLPSDYEGKSIVLNFDGSYNHTYVYVNGTKVGENHYGYNDFAFDISKHLICDGKTENVISVKVVHQTPSSRWYSGSGIYRDVELIVTDAVHVSRNGVYVTTPELATEKGGNVTVKVQTKVQNDGDAQVAAKIRTTVLDAEGKAVSEASTTDVTLTENGTEEKEQNLKVNNPALWSTEKPNLYYVQTEVLVGDEVKDINKETFGFRYIDFNSNTGFSLNGKNVKLKGVCMHHDQGALGSASEHDAVYRQVSKLKEMGCNAIRTAHNTPSSVLLKACNELGMMVMDETFDGWAFPKNGNSQDFSTHYNKTISEDNKLLGATAGDTWYKFVLESNIERDKNDPSVVIWDIGNELNFGVTDPSKYEQYAKNMKSYIEAIDKTRPITVGDNNPYGLRYNTYGDFRNKVTAVLANKGEGLAGANYSMAAMSGIHSAHPDWKIIATETASPSNSRGIYTTLSQYGKSGDYQCTAYDTNAVSWGNTARESWWYTIKDDFVSGEFIWTGFDYIGEPTPWNGTGKGSVSGDKLAVPNSSYFGVIDTAGFEKDSFYFYTSQWREDKQTLHIVPQSWNKKDLSISGGNVPVYVYSNAAKVELYLNGKLIGTSTRNPIKTAAGHEWATYSNESNDEEQCVAVNESPEWKAQAIQFKVKYAEGTLSAKAYDEDGKEITDTLGSQSVTTNSDAGSKLSVKAEKSEITADGSSLSYIAVDVNDKDGRFVSSADNSIRFTLTGNGTIVGVDNGNPSTVNKFQQKSVLTSSKTAKIKAFSGKALVIVRSTKDAGGFALKAESAGLTGETVFVNTVGEKNGEVKEAVNIAPKYKTLKESCGEPADNLLSIVDGVNNVLNKPNMRWTNWNDHLLNSSPTITFTWDEVYELASINAWFFGDANVGAPESVTIAVSKDGENFKEVEFTHDDYQVNQKSELVFNEVQKAKALRFTMKQVGTGYVGLTELEIWTSAKGYTSNKTAELEGLKVDGTAVEGFAADKYEYTVVVDKVDQAVVDATAKDNASVMVVPFNKENVVKVIVTSEDSKITNTYKIKLIAKDQIADKAFMEKVEGEIKQAEALKKDDYTDSSYAEYEKALKEVKAVIAKEIVTKDEVNAALEKLQTARGNLVKVTKPAPDTNKNPEKPSANKPETGVPSVGMLIKYKKAIYKVREVNATGGTVMLVKRNSKKAKFVIPATIKSGNYTFKVTSIANKAFKGDKKLKKVVIGKNVQVIGKRAFEKAKNLRSITIKSVSLKKVGRSAFKGIHAKAKIKVPAKKMRAYKRLLKKKGQKSSVKIIK